MIVNNSWLHSVSIRLTSVEGLEAHEQQLTVSPVAAKLQGFCKINQWLTGQRVH